MPGPVHLCRQPARDGDRHKASTPGCEQGPVTGRPRSRQRAWRSREGRSRSELSASRGVMPANAAATAQATPSSAARDSTPRRLPLRSSRRRRHSWYLCVARARKLPQLQVPGHGGCSWLGRSMTSTPHNSSGPQVAERSAASQVQHHTPPHTLCGADLLAGVKQELAQEDEV